MARGGARPGSGRKKGTGTAATTVATRKKAALMMEFGISPLDVFMGDLRFWDREIRLLEAEIEAARPANRSILLATGAGRFAIDRYLEARKAILVSAEKAAPFVHPRMQPVSDAPADLSKLTDEELDAIERISRKIAGSFGDPR